jgi:hypothetical protein
MFRSLYPSNRRLIVLHCRSVIIEERSVLSLVVLDPARSLRVVTKPTELLRPLTGLQNVRLQWNTFWCIRSSKKPQHVEWSIRNFRSSLQSSGLHSKTQVSRECFNLKIDTAVLQNIGKFRQSTLRDIPEDLNLHHYCCLDSISRRAELLTQIWALAPFTGATHVC